MGASSGTVRTGQGRGYQWRNLEILHRRFTWNQGWPSPSVGDVPSFHCLCIHAPHLGKVQQGLGAFLQALSSTDISHTNRDNSDKSCQYVKFILIYAYLYNK